MATKKAVQDFVAITEDGYRVIGVGEEVEASDEFVLAKPLAVLGLGRRTGDGSETEDDEEEA